MTPYMPLYGYTQYDTLYDTLYGTLYDTLHATLCIHPIRHPIWHPIWHLTCHSTYTPYMTPIWHPYDTLTTPYTSTPYTTPYISISVYMTRPKCVLDVTYHLSHVCLATCPNMTPYSIPNMPPYTCGICIYNTSQVCGTHRVREVGGWGRDPKKCTGRGWGMGSSTI